MVGVLDRLLPEKVSVCRVRVGFVDESKYASEFNVIDTGGDDDSGVFQ